MERTYIIDTLNEMGKTVRIMGWVDTKRDHGKLTFIDLKDRTAKIQCVGIGMMSELTAGSVIEIVGDVQARPVNMVNSDIETGTVEVSVKEYKVLNKSKELPIPIDTEGYEVNEEARLKYRYLDLRRDRLRKTLALRSKYAKYLRDALYKRDFVEVETPILTKATKEGSRDFVVPSRYNPGKFYALPQSPQQYKQLLMTAGVEKYFQFARCIRDEDPRADRGYEHTQLDIEISFVNREEIMQIIEEIVKEAVKSANGKLKDEVFPVVDYADAISKYGADKFDLRTEEDKKNGVLSFAWVINFPFFKRVDKSDVAEVRDGKSGWTFTHNPFSNPLPEHIEWHLKGEHIENILTTQYDLVCNGYEVGGGSIRAHDPDVLRSTFKIMGYNEEQTHKSVGHMIEALELGTPPHGGIALGLDRHVMLLAGETSLKEAIAFPMTSSGKTAVMDAPSELENEQLKELHIKVIDN
jgi:aspartyl-tRNA synthetase